MLYIDNETIKSVGFTWDETISTIEEAIICMYKEEWAQPIKPYLRYGNPRNRIIAMPAYVGGNIKTAGIKWISSFPDNINRNMPRAHCVVILNESDTGIPKAILNASLVSIIRTASVSGVVIKKYLHENEGKTVNIGIIGWGPIGQYHYKMLCSILGERINKVFLYDKKKIILEQLIENANKIEIVDQWEKAYDDVDIFLTCTVSNERYINKPPKEGSLLLNVSLRDYQPDIYNYVKNSIIVDDWNEVCREDTDIERISQAYNLRKEMTHDLIDVLVNDYFKSMHNKTVMFNPMGMGVFDIAIGEYFYLKAMKDSYGINL